MMDIEIYLHKMMANGNLREDLVKHGDRNASLLKHPACELIKQTEFDFDLIEVMLPCGTCFRISETGGKRSKRQGNGHLFSWESFP